MWRSYLPKVSFSSIFPRFLKKNNDVQRTQYETSQREYVVFLQDILTWQNKTRTIVAIFVTYIALWFIYWVLLNPYYSLSMFALVMLSNDAWFNYIWPEIRLPGAHHSWHLPTFRLVLGSQLENHLYNMQQSLSQLKNWGLQTRADSPGVFCILLSLLWLGLTLIFSLLPGVVWGHILFVLVWVSQLGLNLPTFQLWQDDLQQDLDDLIPQLSDSELQVLEDAKDATEGLDFQTEDMFHLSSVPVIKDDSDDELPDSAGLHFVPYHYDHSDEESEEFSSGLQFTEPPADTKLQYMSTIYDAMKKGQSMLNYLSSSTQSVSTTEDFEVISDSEIDC